jgi:hypothetical protein
MRSAVPLVLLTSLVTAVSAGVAAPSDTSPSDDITVALQSAQRLQDEARALRNGARSGAAIAELARVQDRLRDSLRALVQGHERWASTLAPDERRRIADRLTAIGSGCERIRANLGRLGAALADRDVDRARIQELGQAIGRQSGMCERALRAAERERRARPT